jgi:hypothetical protein
MHRAAHDQGFVAVGPSAVYAALAHLPGYPAWWPDARADGQLELRLGGRLLRAEASAFRPDIGLIIHLRGAFPGTLEWHLEPGGFGGAPRPEHPETGAGWRADPPTGEDDGTIVNSILNIEPTGGRRRAERRLRLCRASIRRALVGLKGALE